MSSKVLVLLATYNGEKWLQNQIETILFQKNVDVTVLASDDGSSDQSLEILNSYSSEKFIILINKSNSGSAGKNFINLIVNSSPKNFDFIALADQDDIWDENKLFYGIKSLTDHNSDAYSSAVYAFGILHKKITQNPKIKAADFIFEGAGQGCTFILTRNSFSRIREFIIKNYPLVEDFHYHDWLVYLLVRAFGMSWFFDKNGYMLYRQHGENEIGARGNFTSFHKRFLLIRSGWYSKQIDLAIKVFSIAGSASAKINYFSSVFYSKPKFLRQIKLALFIIFNGRRRLSDRLFLAIASLFFWI